MPYRHFRSTVAADILRRYLKFKGLKIKTRDEHHGRRGLLLRSHRQAGLSIDDYTAKIHQALWEDFDALGCERPEIVLAHAAHSRNGLGS